MFGGVDDVVDLDAELARLGDVLARPTRPSTARWFSSGRSGSPGVAGVELDERAADLDARAPGGRARAALKPSAVRRGGRRGSGRAERDVVEVVLDVGRRLDEPEPQPLADVEVGLAVARRSTSGRRRGRARPLEVDTRSADVLERAAFARALGGEERQLAAPRVGADERERVRAVDHVHPELPVSEVGDGVAVGDPEGDVVERLGLTPARISICYFRRSTARWIAALFIFERPEMFIRFASL